MSLIINKLKTGPWNLSDLKEVKKINKKVFSCFSCGGGSTMGYKLSGFDVLGNVEIDPQMMAIYKENHKPKYPFLMGVQDFKNIPNEELPEELFNLDILDGSPPCSSFSLSGPREKGWGKAKKFREGQAYQVLDDLFFHFIDIAKKLQPKVVVAENVKGLIQGNAKGYVKEIFREFRNAGYSTQLFLLNASKMGVPQRRERTFFIANKLGKKINLEFNEDEVSFKKACEGIKQFDLKFATEEQEKLWKLTKPGEKFSKYHPNGSWFHAIKVNPNKPANTLAASGGAGGLYHYNEPRKISDKETLRIQSYPDNFNFLDSKSQYICGMSVPPFMIQRVSTEIYKQLLNG